MEKKDIIWLATKCFAKNWEFEQLKYSDDLYGKEKYAGEVWEYVEELENIGKIAFYEKYKEYKLF